MKVLQLISKWQKLCLLMLWSLLITSSVVGKENIIRIERLIVTKQSVGLPKSIHEKISNFRLVQISYTDSLLRVLPPEITVQLGDILPTMGATSLPRTVSLRAFDVLASEANLVIGTNKGDKAINVRFAAFEGILGMDGWISLSISRVGILGLIKWGTDTYVIEPIKIHAPAVIDSRHFIYKIDDMKQEEDWCSTDTQFLPFHLKQFMKTTDLFARKTISQLTAELAIETDYETYVSFGNDSEQTTAYLLSIIANASQIYEREVDLKLEVVFSRVWTTPDDPYTQKGGSLLPEFQNFWNANMQHVERDLALLLIKDRTRLSGGRASFDKACNKKFAYAVSGENIRVVTHELGHLFGAVHTHNCAWPAGPGGTLAPIDSCATVEGNCGIDEIVPQDGTIMSYCIKKVSFHPLVRNFIRARVEAKTCIGTGTESKNSISGTVTWNSARLADVTIAAVRSSTVAQLSRETISTTTDSEGSFSITLSNDSYYISAERDSFLISPVGYTSSSIQVIVAGIDVAGVDFEAVELQADQYEPDNEVGQAVPISANGEIQHHTLHIDSDLDYVRFDAVSGQTYLAMVHLDGRIGGVLPRIALLDMDGTTEIARSGFPPAIEWEAPVDGTYFIRLSGHKSIYGLSVSSTLFSNTEATITGLEFSAADWGDYDGDGDLDLLVAGRDADGNNITTLFRNDQGQFVDAQVGFVPIGLRGSVVWGDFDNDGDLDALLVGGNQADVYINERGSFASKISIDSNLSRAGSAACGDYDNDGDLDVLIQSLTDLNQPGKDFSMLRLYRNDQGSFVNTNLGLRGVDFGKVRWGDFDRDGDLDIIVAGSSLMSGQGGNSFDNPFTKIYRNDEGSFVETDVRIDSVAGYPDIAFGDFDSDGDLDLAMSGKNETSLISKIYRNDNGFYTELSFEMTGVHNASIAWGDYDNDGDLDIIISGQDKIGSSASPSTKLYVNDGGAFEESPFNTLLPQIAGVVLWSDYDHDGDIDLFLLGEGSNGLGQAHLLRNETVFKNTPPSSPAGLNVVDDGSSVTLSWFPAQDDQTFTEGLTYNLRIGTSLGGIDFLAPMSDVKTGMRQVVRMGNNGHLTQRTFQNLQTGQTYYWSVQAIDNSFAGSGWALEESFTVGEATSVEQVGDNVPIVHSLYQNYPNPFNPMTTITFDLPQPGNVVLTVYDVLGREVEVLVSGDYPAGSFKARWNATGFASGVYVYKLQAGRYTETRKMQLVK